MAVVQSEGTIMGVAGPLAQLGSPPLTGIVTYSGMIASYQTIYRTQPNVRTVVSFLGKNIAQLDMKLFRRKSDAEREHLRDHPAARTLRHPNHRTSRYSFMRALVEDLGTFDNAFAVKVRDPRVPNVVELIRVPPQFVAPMGENWLWADAYKLLGTRNQPEIPWGQMIHLHGYNPDDARWGLSPIETLRRILAEDAAAGEFREQLWGRGARTTGIITRPAEAPRWSPNARARFREEWYSAYANVGPEAGGTPILEDGMTYAPANFNAQELEYLGARKLTRAEVSAAYHVDPVLSGLGDGGQSAGADDGAHRRLYQDAFAPLCTFLAEDLALQLIPDFETDPTELDILYFEHNLDEKLRGDFLAEAEATSRAVGGPWLLRNEARARRNLPPIDGGNDLIVPLNVTTGGRASPADTAPGTPGLGQAALPAPVNTKAATKAAVDALPDHLQPWVHQVYAVMAGVIARQRASVMSKLGAGRTAAEAFGQVEATGRFPRWDGELGDALAGVALELAPVAAAPIAERFGIEYAAEVATAWLINNARIAAEVYNDGTYNALAAVELGLGGDATAASVFDDAEGFRLDTYSIDRTGTVSNFAAADAASQAGATTKTWVVHGRNPRMSHARMSGETVPAGETFSNGGMWPHDPNLPVEELAGCTCGVDFTEADLTDAPSTFEE